MAGFSEGDNEIVYNEFCENTTVDRRITIENLYDESVLITLADWRDGKVILVI